MANFSLGMQKLKPEDVKHFSAEVSKLGSKRDVWAPLGAQLHSSAANQSPQSVASNLSYGQCFAESEIILQIEEFAMNYVTNLLENDGWNVDDKSNDKGLGYDLLCRKVREIMHV